MMRKVDRGSPPRSGPGKRSPRRRRRAAVKRSHDRLRTIYSVSVLSARSRIATDAVESGGIGIIVPISGNHVFPLVAHPRLWISAASTPLALDNFLQLRNAGAAIGAGAKRSPDIGDVCGTPFSHSAADGFKSDTVTGADDRPGFGNALGALAGKKKTPVALGQNSRIEQRAHDLPSRRVL